MRTTWQPIATMPKDGTMVLVTNGKTMFVANQPPGCSLGRWAKARSGGWYGAFESIAPTHWMPLPPQPPRK